MSNVFDNYGEKFISVNRQNIESVLKTDFKDYVLGETVGEILKEMISFAEDNHGFLCAVTSVGISKHIIYMLFYTYHDMRLRVGLEYSKCQCGWNGTVANPLVPYLYETLDNRFTILNELKNKISFLNCPICNQPLNRPAIWLQTDK